MASWKSIVMAVQAPSATTAATALNAAIAALPVSAQPNGPAQAPVITGGPTVSNDSTGLANIFMSVAVSYYG